MSTLRANSIEHTDGGAITLNKQSASKVWMHHNYSDNTYRHSYGCR